MSKVIWLVPFVPFAGLTFNRAVYHYALFLGFGDTGADVASFIGTLVVAFAALFLTIAHYVDEVHK